MYQKPPSDLIRKDDEGNCHVLFFRIWVEIDNGQYETMKETAQNDEEHSEINKIQ